MVSPTHFDMHSCHCVPVPYVNPLMDCLLINELTLYGLAAVASVHIFD